MLHREMAERLVEDFIRLDGDAQVGGWAGGKRYEVRCGQGQEVRAIEDLRRQVRGVIESVVGAVALDLMERKG